MPVVKAVILSTIMCYKVRGVIDVGRLDIVTGVGKNQIVVLKAFRDPDRFAGGFQVFELSAFTEVESECPLLVSDCQVGVNAVAPVKFIVLINASQRIGWAVQYIRCAFLRAFQIAEVGAKSTIPGILVMIAFCSHCPVIIIIEIHGMGECDAFNVINTRNLSARFPSLVQRRQQDAHKDGDDCDYYQ